MACGTRLKSKCMKSCERFYNNSNQAVAASTTPLQLQLAGARVVDSGLSIQAEPGAYTILKTGLYHISGDVDFEASAGGKIIFVAYLDGVELPCTKRTLTVGSSGFSNIHTETELAFEHCCQDINKAITFALISDGTSAGTVRHLCTGITKLA